MQSPTNRSPRPALVKRTRAIPGTSARQVLKEVHQLLEKYAPTWYTESLHNRIEAALVAGADHPSAPSASPPRTRSAR